MRRLVLLIAVCLVNLPAVHQAWTDHQIASDGRDEPSSTTSIAASTMAPPSSIREPTASPPSSTAKKAAKTGSMLITIAVRVGESCDWAQVWAIRATAPATSAM